MPASSEDPSVRRSREPAKVRAQRRSVEPVYATRSTGASGAGSRNIQILFLTS
jgi:hypothetical protein